MVFFFIIVFLIVLYLVLYKKRLNVKFLKGHCSIIFGLPGSGKTTLAAAVALYCSKKGYLCFTNFETKGAGTFKVPEDITRCDYPEGSWIILDEAGSIYNNRNFKKFSDTDTEFFKMHRHHKYTIILLSQALDVDLKIKNVSHRFFEVRKSLLPGISKLVEWKRSSAPTKSANGESIDVIPLDEITVYVKVPTFVSSHLLCKRYNRAAYRKVFNSYSYIPSDEVVKFERW